MTEWTRSDTLALASSKCTHCFGLGNKLGKRNAAQPCKCVLRSIFRICFDRFRQCMTKEKHLSQVSLEYTPQGGRRITWGRKVEEYCADFLLVSQRSLEPEEYRIFSYHFLLGADWKLCCRRLNMDRGNFFHSVYRIQEKLGRVFRELQPYSLFPLDEYFNGCTVNDAALPEEKTAPPKVVPMRPGSLNSILDLPVRKVA